MSRAWFCQGRCRFRLVLHELWPNTKINIVRRAPSQRELSLAFSHGIMFQQLIGSPRLYSIPAYLWASGLSLLPPNKRRWLTLFRQLISFNLRKFTAPLRSSSDSRLILTILKDTAQLITVDQNPSERRAGLPEISFMFGNVRLWWCHGHGAHFLLV